MLGNIIRENASLLFLTSHPVKEAIELMMHSALGFD
jgi:hypothetical protein